MSANNSHNYYTARMQAAKLANKQAVGFSSAFTTFYLFYFLNVILRSKLDQGTFLYLLHV